MPLVTKKTPRHITMFGITLLRESMDTRIERAKSVN